MSGSPRRQAGGFGELGDRSRVAREPRGLEVGEVAERLEGGVERLPSSRARGGSAASTAGQHSSSSPSRISGTAGASAVTRPGSRIAPAWRWSIASARVGAAEPVLGLQPPATSPSSVPRAGCPRRPSPRGMPLPSHRANFCSSGSLTVSPNPSRSAKRPVMRQSATYASITARMPVRISDGAGADSLQRPAVGSGPREEVARHSELGRADVVEPVPELDVVTEELGHLVRVGGAADHRQQRHPVDATRRPRRGRACSARRVAIRHERKPCSIGCPSPRSVASENAATTSTSRGAECSSGAEPVPASTGRPYPYSRCSPHPASGA